MAERQPKSTRAITARADSITSHARVNVAYDEVVELYDWYHGRSVDDVIVTITMPEAEAILAAAHDVAVRAGRVAMLRFRFPEVAAQADVVLTGLARNADKHLAQMRDLLPYDSAEFAEWHLPIGLGTQDRDRIRRALARGASLRILAKEYGVSKSTIANWRDAVPAGG